MVVKVFAALLSVLFLSACAVQAPHSLPSHFLGTWHGLSDERFSYEFYEDGHYRRIYTPTGEINDEGDYKVLGQDDSNNIYILTRETWYRPNRGSYIYDYKKLMWENAMFDKPSLDIKHGGPMVSHFSEENWNMPPWQHMQAIRGEQKKYSSKSTLGAFSSRSSYIRR